MRRTAAAIAARIALLVAAWAVPAALAWLGWPLLGFVVALVVLAIGETVLETKK